MKNIGWMLADIIIIFYIGFISIGTLVVAHANTLVPVMCVPSVMCYEAYPLSLLVYVGLMAIAAIKNPKLAPFLALFAITLSELAYNVIVIPPTLRLFPVWAAWVAICIWAFRKQNYTLKPTWLLPIYIFQNSFFAANSSSIWIPHNVIWPPLVGGLYLILNEMFVCVVAWRMLKKREPKGKP